MTLLMVDWLSVGVKAGQFILSFSILVTLHELGHFIPAKLFNCRVDKFYLFFDPWFSIWKKKKGETEYGIGWVPFGGYVKIAGMIDESMDKEQMNKPPEPHEFRSKPAWQRLIIMIGGVLVNVVLAIVIFIGITWVWGEEYLPVKNLKNGIVADSLAKSIGIKDGDNVVGIDGKPLEAFGTLEAEMVLNDAKVFLPIEWYISILSDIENQYDAVVVISDEIEEAKSERNVNSLKKRKIILWDGLFCGCPANAQYCCGYRPAWPPGCCAQATLLRHSVQPHFQ